MCLQGFLGRRKSSPLRGSSTLDGDLVVPLLPLAAQGAFLHPVHCRSVAVAFPQFELDSVEGTAVAARSKAGFRPAAAAVAAEGSCCSCGFVALAAAVVGTVAVVAGSCTVVEDTVDSLRCTVPSTQKLLVDHV